MAIWKENIIEDLENDSLVFAIVGEFLTDLKQEFSREDETMKVEGLKKIEQENKIMKEFIQKFRRAARGSRYEESIIMMIMMMKINTDVSDKKININEN